MDTDTGVERSPQHALGVFVGIHTERGFLGICLDDRHVLQLRSEEAVYSTEDLDTQAWAVEHCILSRPLAEVVSRQAYRDGGFHRVAADSFIQWQHESVSADNAA